MTAALQAGGRPVRSRAEARVADNRLRLAVAVLFGLALTLAGGASRADETAQGAVRLASIIALAATLCPMQFARLSERQALLAAVGLVWCLPALQLIPLPPGLWAHLPGHALYAQAALWSGTVGWRPLSLTPDLTLNALFALLPPTAVTLAAIHLERRDRRRLLVEGVLVIALGSTALALLQRILPQVQLSLYRVTSENAAIGLMANRNHQAALLAFALPFAGAWGALKARNAQTLSATAAVVLTAAAVLLLGIVLTGSRMGLVLGCLGAAGGLWCWRAGGLPLVPQRVAARLGLAATALAVLAGLGVVAMRGDAIARLAGAQPIDQSRAAMVKPLVATAREFMPLGAGFGAFDSVYRQFEPAALLSTIYMNQAHDEPLQLAIEGGAPALVLLLLFLGWWSWAGFRSARARGSPSDRAAGVASLVATGLLLLSSLVDYPLRTPLLASLFALACLQMLEAFKAPQTGRRATRRSSPEGLSAGRP